MNIPPDEKKLTGQSYNELKRHEYRYELAFYDRPLSFMARSDGWYVKYAIWTMYEENLDGYDYWVVIPYNDEDINNQLSFEQICTGKKDLVLVRVDSGYWPGDSMVSPGHEVQEAWVFSNFEDLVTTTE